MLDVSSLHAALNQRRQMESGAVWASQILPDLFLGRGADASNKAQLRAHGVTHVLNCADDVPDYFRGEFTYCNLGVGDFGTDTGIARVFETARAFVEGLRVESSLTRAGGEPDAAAPKVLVHCANGRWQTHCKDARHMIL